MTGSLLTIVAVLSLMERPPGCKRQVDLDVRQRTPCLEEQLRGPSCGHGFRSILEGFLNIWYEFFVQANKGFTAAKLEEQISVQCCDRVSDVMACPDWPETRHQRAGEQ